MLTTRRTVAALLALSAAAFATASVALAGATQSFDAAAFEAAQKSGKPVLIDVTAPWCPTCKAQSAVLTTLRGQEKFKDLVTFTVDFDSQKPLLAKLKVQSQSTLIVYKGDKEVGRLVGDTQAPSIEALLAKGL